MSELHAPRQSSGDPTVVHLVGDLDLGAREAVRARLAAAFELGAPVIVDIGDCTYAGVEVLELLFDASDQARTSSSGFVVVLPYSADALVRRLVLEIAPELASFPVVASVRAARALLARSPAIAPRSDENPRRLALRASVWENASRVDELLAQSTAAVVAARETRERIRARRRS